MEIINEGTVKSEIENWLNMVDFKLFYKSIEKSIIGQDNLKIVLANVYNYLTNIVKDKPVHNNMLLAAPSGCGKTETYRALKAYFKVHIPDMVVSIADASLLTAAGFKGGEPYELLINFFNKGIKNAIGICFLDEFDKKIAPSYNQGNSNLNEDAQSNLLTMIEGSTIANRMEETINTEKIMFVGLGSFDFWRKKRECSSNEVGFNSVISQNAHSHYDDITREQIIDSGGINELIGRFPIIVNYHKLSELSLKQIIKDITCNLQESFNCSIKIRKKYMNMLLENANSNFGCRLLDSLIRTDVVNEYAEALIEATDEKQNKELEIILDEKNKSRHQYLEKTVRRKTQNKKNEALVSINEPFFELSVS